MVPCKLLIIILYMLLVIIFKDSLTSNFCNGELINCGSYCSRRLQRPGPMQFITCPTLSTQNQCVLNAPYPIFDVPVYSNTPTISYEEFEEAKALKEEYPNQPIIIINNNVHNKDCDKDKKTDNDECFFDHYFVELLKVILETRALRRRDELNCADTISPPVPTPFYPIGVIPNNHRPVVHEKAIDLPPTSSDLAIAPTSVAFGCYDRSRYPININIVLPSSAKVITENKLDNNVFAGEITPSNNNIDKVTE